MAEFKLPDPGEGLVEADIVTWRVAVGDEVAVNDILVEIETAKSIVELPSPFAGTVAALLVNEGDTVEVGTPIIRIDEVGAEPSTAAEADDSAAAEARTPNLVGYGAIASSSRRRARKQPASAAATAAAEPVSAPQSLVPEPSGSGQSAPEQAPASAPEPRSRVRAKPPVRKLAKDHGVDLTQLVPAGADGIITREQVTAMIEQGAPAVDTFDAGPLEDTAGGQASSSRSLVEQRIAIKGVRKATAQAMVDSAFTAPHAMIWTEIDVTASVEFLARLGQRREFADVRLSPTVLIARAVCLAALRTPEINSSWDEAAGEIIQHGQVNLGIAAATPRGLVVPNIKGADRLDLVDLAGALTDLVTTARAGRTQPAQMSGGTITITNIGVFGIEGGAPILNPGESAILAAGAITRKPWVVGTGAKERIEPRSVMTLALSFDHRVIDGEQGSRYLSDLAQLLSDPANALLY